MKIEIFILIITAMFTGMGVMIALLTFIFFVMFETMKLQK